MTTEPQRTSRLFLLAAGLVLLTRPLEGRSAESFDVGLGLGPERSRGAESSDGAQAVTVSRPLVAGVRQELERLSSVQLSPLTNGGFEHDENGDGEPDGWKVHGRVERVSQSAVGRWAVWLTGPSRRPRAMLKQRVTIPQPAPEVVSVSGLVRGEGIDGMTDALEGVATVSIRFLDVAGKRLGSKKLARWFGDFEWKPWSSSVRVPKDTAQLELVLELDDAIGSAWFDEVQLLWGLPDDRDRDNLLVDGGFEHRSALSPWNLGKGHQIVFPGSTGRGALELAQETPASSVTSQSWIVEPHGLKALRCSLSVKLKGVTAVRDSGGVIVSVQFVEPHGQSPWHPDTTPQLGRHPAHRLDEARRAHGRRPWPDGGVDHKDQPLALQRIFGPLAGSADWSSLSKEIAVPPGVHRGTLRLAMHQATGAALFDGARLEAIGSVGRIERPLVSKTLTEGWRPVDPIVPALVGPFDASDLLDPPAGRHGFLQVNHGRFVFGDGTPIRFFGVNIQGAAALPTHEEAKRLAARLAQMGCNIVRLHHLDSPWERPNLFDASFGDTQHLSAESLNRLDYFMAQLKAHGIYVYLDLLVSRQFEAHDGVRAARRLGKGAKGVAQYSPRLIQLQKQYARDLLTHGNPYTKTRLVDEPAIALIDLINESSLFELPKLAKQIPQVYLDELYMLWQEYLAGQGLTASDPEARLFDSKDSLTQAFYASLQLRYFEELSGYLRGLGLKIPIAGSNLSLEGHDLLTNAHLDFIDRHAYWDHPEGGFGDLVKVHNRSLLKEVDRHNPIVRLSRQRVAGKPFVVSEWGIPWPNEYRAVGPLLMAAYGSFQDWDGLIQFNYQGKLPTKIEGNFDVSTKPELFLQFPVASRLFHRHDVRRARIRQNYPIVPEPEIPPWLFMRHGLERIIPPPGWSRRRRDGSLHPVLRAAGEPRPVRLAAHPADRPAVSQVVGIMATSDLQDKRIKWSPTGRARGTFSDARGAEPRTQGPTPRPIHPRAQPGAPWVRGRHDPSVSDTGELRWDATRGVVLIDSPRTQAALGKVGAHPLLLGDVTFRVTTPFASVALISLDEKPLASSGHLLLVTVARSENTGTIYNATRTLLRKSGGPPILMEPVFGTATLRLRNRRPRAVLTLEASGRRGDAAAARQKGDSLEIPLGQAHAYEILLK